MKENSAQGKCRSEWRRCRQDAPLLQHGRPSSPSAARPGGAHGPRPGDVQTQQRAGPRRAPHAQRAAAGQPAGQHRDAEEGDQQAGAERDHRYRVAERQRRQRETEEEDRGTPARCARRRVRAVPRARGSRGAAVRMRCACISVVSMVSVVRSAVCGGSLGSGSRSGKRRPSAVGSRTMRPSARFAGGFPAPPDLRKSCRRICSAARSATRRRTSRPRSGPAGAAGAVRTVSPLPYPRPPRQFRRHPRSGRRPANPARTARPPSPAARRARPFRCRAVQPRPAPPVVRHLDQQPVLDPPHLDGRLPRRAVLRDVLQQFGDGEVGDPLDGGAGRSVRSTEVVTGTVQRPASEASAGPSPRSVRIAGWMPRARSRSSCSASFTSPCASSTIAAAASGSSSSFSLARPRPMASATSRACAPSCRSRSMRRRSAAAVSVTVIRSDSSSAIRRSSSSEGESSPRTIARSTFDSQRASQGSTGQPTKSETSVTAKVSTAQGSRTKANSACRQATGSFRHVHIQGNNPRSAAAAAELGSSTRTPSSARARARSSLSVPTARHQARGQQRQPDHGDGQSDPEYEPDHQHHEREHAHGEIGEQIRDLPPGPGAERCRGRGWCGAVKGVIGSAGPGTLRHTPSLPGRDPGCHGVRRVPRVGVFPMSPARLLPEVPVAGGRLPGDG